MRHMAVMESVPVLSDKVYIRPNNWSLPSWNAAFYTTDGMRYEFFDNISTHQALYEFKLYESDVVACAGSLSPYKSYAKCGGCGSLGLTNNLSGTTKPPCIISVDVNGDRKPSPANGSCKESACMTSYKYQKPNGAIFSDTFSIMITEDRAIPYGIAAQKAMYSSQKQPK